MIQRWSGCTWSSSSPWHELMARFRLSGAGAWLFPRHARRDDRLANIRAIDRHVAQQPPVNVAVAIDARHSHRAAVEQVMQLVRRRIAEPRFLGAARRVSLRRV